MGILGVSKLALIAVGIGVVVALLASINFQVDSTEPEILNSTGQGISKAIIIDQLSHDYPNEEFDQNATKFLKDAGYDQVDLVLYDDITVDFYKKLPSMNYKFIVARTHALAIKETGKTSVWMFTGENYTESKYIQEQLYGQVSRGVPFLVSSAEAQGFAEASQKRLFILGNKFVDEEMEGKFPGSTIVLGGCDTMSYPHMARSLVERGASSIIGWHGLIGVGDNDEAMLMVLEEILVNEKDPDDAVDFVMKSFEGISHQSSTLRHYSSGASTFDILS